MITTANQYQLEVPLKEIINTMKAEEIKNKNKLSIKQYLT